MKDPAAEEYGRDLQTVDQTCPSARLRSRAEQALRLSARDLGAISREDMQFLIHELQVYQVELELQNEALRHTQLELAATRDRFSDLYEFAPIGYLTIAENGKIQQANLTATEMLGVMRNRLVGASFSDYVAPEGREAWHLHCRNVFAENGKQVCELPLNNCSPRTHWARIESNAIRESSMVYCRTVLVDITDRKRAEHQLLELKKDLEVRVEKKTSESRKGQQQIKALLDAAPDSIITIDRQARIVSVNLATQRIFGYQSHELVGKEISLLLPSGDWKKYLNAVHHYLQADERNVTRAGKELQARKITGEAFPVELSINEIVDEGLFIGIVRDISERKSLEAQVVEASNREQRRIGQDIHDGIGQEMTGLRYMAQTHLDSLRKNASPDAKVAERISQWLGTIQQQFRQIIRQVIPVEIDELGLVAAVRGLAEQTSADYDLSCQFVCHEPISIGDLAAATHLFRIAQEAVRNAVRHASAKLITVRLEEDEEQIQLIVTDDGVGISNTATPGKKRGIGLNSMAYRAGLIGAQIIIDDVKPHGTEVRCVVSRGRTPNS
ncbi:PAS domain S-box protein [bacterium]|nr:PAS domain S-box protein [bacterium]